MTKGNNLALRSLCLRNKQKDQAMGATTIGALLGGAIDSMSGEDSAVDGAIYGALTANVLRVVLPVVVTYAVGWAVLRGLGELKDRAFGETPAVPSSR
ncbi:MULTISPECIES: hypothetical protein [unclassified Sphingomonas]|uniref:hypothetical protein n=1 Tax=unclassified Sphingomonas TaxID=196159 RepID=UPI00267D1B4A